MSVHVHYLVKRAIASGEIKRARFCESCRKRRFLVAHHDDYSKPLSVRWLCRSCHYDWHHNNGTGLNAELFNMPVRGPKPPRLRKHKTTMVLDEETKRGIRLIQKRHKLATFSEAAMWAVYRELEKGTS